MTTPYTEVGIKITIPRALLAALVSDEPCDFDHHGGCQAHMYLSLRAGELCPHEEAKRYLDATDDIAR